MTVDRGAGGSEPVPGEGAGRAEAADIRKAAHPDGAHPDAGHLDEDPEALEDPVHCGDAHHQHELHTHPHGRAD